MTEVLERPVPADPAPEPVSPTPTVESRAVGTRAAIGGALAMVAGLVIDAVQHGSDPARAASERLVELGSLGHVLLVAGAGTVVAGLALAALGPMLYDAPGPVTSARRLAQLGAPVALLALFVGAVVWGARADTADEHVTTGAMGPMAGMDHGNAGQPAAAHPEAPTGSGGHVHGEGPPVPLDEATQKQLSAEMARTREATMRYPTVADAEAAGLRRVGTFAPGSGAHYYLPPPPPGFDAGVPTMWLYAGNEPTSGVVGVMFYSLNAEAPPEGFAGNNDHWHQHSGLCIRNIPEGIDLPLPVDRDATEPQCTAVGGKFINATGWMIHAWTAPGWESPQGVFSHDNPLLVCSDGKSAAEAQLHVGCKGMA